jgi:hypothetical protein
MHNAALVGAVNCSSQRLDQLRRLARRLGFVAYHLVQRRAVDEFERQIRVALMFAHLIDLNDVRMLQAG